MTPLNITVIWLYCYTGSCFKNGTLPLTIYSFTRRARLNLLLWPSLIWDLCSLHCFWGNQWPSVGWNSHEALYFPLTCLIQRGTGPKQIFSRISHQWNIEQKCMNAAISYDNRLINSQHFALASLLIWSATSDANNLVLLKSWHTI